jgi:cell division protein FtsQ
MFPEIQKTAFMWGKVKMAGDYVLDNSETQTGFGRFIKIFIVIAALCLGAELIWLLGVSPFRPFSKIDITGFDEIGREEILSIAGIGASSSYFSTDTTKVENALMGISSIESARVFKFFPGRMRIVLEGRKPVAFALADSENGTVPVVFDSHGVIYEVNGKNLTEGNHGPSARTLQAGRMVPVVSGFVIGDPFPGMRLPALFIPFLKELEKIEMSAPELLSAVSEFRIDRKPFDGFDLILYPAHKKMKVRMSELNEDLLRYALLMVDVLSSRESGIDTLDFRSGIASYIPKEAYPE